MHGIYVERPIPKRIQTRAPEAAAQAQARRATLIARVSGGEKYLAVADDMNISRGTAYKWVNAAIDAGELNPTEDDQLVPRKRLNRQRAAALRSLMVDPDMTVKDAAAILHIGESTAHSYRLQFRKEQEAKEKEVSESQEANPDPVPWKDLTSKARGWLKDFSLFREHVLGRTWNPPWAVQTATKLLELYHSDEDEYVVLNVGPGIGKSTLVTHDFAVWVITLERAKGLEPTLLLGHRSMSRSQWYVKRVRATLEYNRMLISNYGRFRGGDRALPWSQDEVSVELLGGITRQEKEPTISSGSYDAALLSGRFKLNIWDDLIDKGNASTVEQREALVSWWEQDAETRMEPGGLTILSNARYGPEDLSYSVRQVLDEEDLDASGNASAIYHHIAFKAHYQELCNGVDHKGNYPDGCLLDERRLNWRRMRKARQNETRFELVYQQGDVDPAGFLAQRIWFDGGVDMNGAIAPGCFRPDLRFGQVPAGRSVLEAAPMLSAVTLDPSGSKFWAAGHFLVWADRVHMLYRCHRAQMQAPEILYTGEKAGQYIGLLEDWWQASAHEGVPFTYLIVENNAAQRWLMQYPFFQEWAMVRGVTLIQHGTNRSNKPDPDRGVEMLGPIYRAGRFWLPYGGYEEKILGDQFRREACSWPEGQFSDLVMMHWFMAHRLDQLLITEVATNGAEGFDDETIPGFAQHRRTPAFADRRLRSLTAERSLSA